MASPVEVRYITSVPVPSQAGQSRQVLSMARAYGQVTKFELCSMHSREAEELSDSVKFSWRLLRCPKHPRWFRQFWLSARTIPFSPPATWLYSRNIAIAALAVLFGRRAVYEMHHPFNNRFSDLLARTICRRLKFVVISASLREHLLARYSIDADYVLVAHDGADPALFEVTPDDLVVRVGAGRSNAPKALYIGSLYAGRGIELILGAAEKLTELDFYIIGGDSADHVRYRGARVLPNVHFLPAVSHDEVPGLICGADLLLMPYTKQTPTVKYMSPLKMFEYMASGRPIVASDIGTVREVLSDSTAFLFDPEAEDAMTLAIRKCLSDQAVAERKAASAKALLLEKYTWKHRVSAIQKFLETR